MATTPTDPIVEMLINGSYVDITADCRLTSADSGGGLEIVRGVPNEGNFAEPTQFNFVLNNGKSKVPSTLGQVAVYSPRNPTGPYFGLIGRNQRVRVSMSRATDDFTRTIVDGWGWMPDKTTLNGNIVAGARWNLDGNVANYDLTGTTATIKGVAATTQTATFGVYGDVEVKTKVRTSVRDSEFGIIIRRNPSMIADVGGLDTTFESGINGWGATGTSVLSWTQSQFKSGLSSLQMTVAGSPASVSVVPGVAQATPVKVAETYRLRFWLRLSISATVTRTFFWYDENQVFISQTTSTLAHTANTWTLNEVTAAAPQGAKFLRAGPSLTGSPANGTLLWLDDYTVHAMSNPSYYAAYLTPGGTDSLRIGKVTPNTLPGPNGWDINNEIGFTNRSANSNFSPNVIVNTWYWMRAQITATRIRMKFWKDGDAEPVNWNWRSYDLRTTDETPVPLTGEVGLIVKDGTSLVTFDSIEVNQWRAHAEITNLPPRWDLSREDKWVPIQARGILRRLGQGRKALASAMTLYLNSFLTRSYGWWNLESDQGESAGNLVLDGYTGALSNITYSEPDLAGTNILPGVGGYAMLAAANSQFSAQIRSHNIQGAAETIMFNFRIPNSFGSDIVIGSFTSTGTAQRYDIVYATAAGIKINAYKFDGTLLSSAVSALYFGTIHPQGSWISATLLLQQVGGNTNWAFNYHRPGQPTFYSVTGSHVGSIGKYTTIKFTGSPNLVTAGGMALTQVMHYAGDLPFVTYDFERASYAYIGEAAGSRALRVAANAGAQLTSTGTSGITEPMGAQTPGKLLEILAECAEVDDGFVIEERDDWGLTIITRASMWNRNKHFLDIDAGHLSAPLDPTDDDQRTRNDVTVSRPNGSFARAIQVSGPLNINPPESDVDGVGIYDEAPEINFATNDQLLAAASFRKSKGTQPEARYPSMRADLTATAYQASPVLAARTLSIDIGDIIDLDNPEVVPEPKEQLVSSYTEKIDLFDYDVTYVAAPAAVRRVGVVNYTTRVDTMSHRTQAAFTSGTDTKLKSELFDAEGSLWVNLLQSERSFPFDIDVAGVRLRVQATGDVLNLNPGFEPPTGIANWSPSSANVTLATDSFVVQRGTQHMRVTALAAGTDGPTQNVSGNVVTVAGATYLLSGWARAEAASTGFHVAVDWYQSNGTTYISSGLPTMIPLSAGVWTFFSATVVAPALGVRARLRARNTFPAAGRLYLESLRIVPEASYLNSPQTLTVEQAPVNGVIKAIPIGSPIRLTAPFRVGW